MNYRRHQAHQRDTKEREFLVKLLVFILIAILACGAPFAAYTIFETTRDLVVVFGIPNVGDIPAIDLSNQPARVVTPPNLAAGERLSVLLLGVDRRPSERCPCRSDTIMIASLDPATDTAGIVTIPRDLYVPIPGVGDNRINVASFYGEQYKYPGGGPGLAKATIEYNFGRKIHYYVLVDFSGFRRIIDTIGGIDIDVARPIEDLTYPDENFGYKPLYVPAGRVHMNGEMALAYARTRHKDGDFGRSRRQIQVLMAIREKAMRLDLVPKLPALIQQLRGTIETDLTPQQAIALAPVAARVRTQNIRMGTIDHTMTVEFRTTNGADVLWPDRAKIGRLMDEIIPREAATAEAGGAIQREGARIMILNGTKSPTLGEKTARLLQTQGFQIAAYGSADRTDYAKSVLIDYSGEKNVTLNLLATIFHVEPENIRRISNVKSDVEIRLILGADWTPP